MQSFIIHPQKWLAGIFISLVFGIARVTAAEPTTNAIPQNLFLTDNGFLFWQRNSGERVVNIKEIRKAQNSPESRPAEQDPEGHWGQITNGFQISLRFEKTTFTNGEPIMSVTLIRNITSEPKNYFRPTHIVATRDGKPLQRKDKRDIDLIEIHALPEVTLYPQTQHRYQENLSRIYDLTQGGEYFFQAVCHHPDVASEKVGIIVVSGAVKSH